MQLFACSCNTGDIIVKKLSLSRAKRTMQSVHRYILPHSHPENSICLPHRVSKGSLFVFGPFISWLHCSVIFQQNTISPPYGKSRRAASVERTRLSLGLMHVKAQRSKNRIHTHTPMHHTDVLLRLLTKRHKAPCLKELQFFSVDYFAIKGHPKGFSSFITQH